MAVLFTDTSGTSPPDIASSGTRWTVPAVSAVRKTADWLTLVASAVPTAITVPPGPRVTPDGFAGELVPSDAVGRQLPPAPEPT